MVGEMSICPLNWAEYYGNVEEALDIIWASTLDEKTKDKLEELLRVDNITGYPPLDKDPIRSWNEAADLVEEICPSNATVPEVDWLRGQVEKLAKGIEPR